jgi:hypothetical protein
VGVFAWLFRKRPSPPRDYSIFVSYSRRDAAIVRSLVEILRLSGAGVFRDVDHIRPGTKWKAVLSEAVDSCELLLLFWCRHSAKSAMVQKEYTQALEAGKLLAPVLLDDTPLGDAVSEYQVIDMRGLFRHDDVEPAGRDRDRSVCEMMEITPEEKQRAARSLDEAGNRLIAGLGTQFGILESRR